MGAESGVRWWVKGLSEGEFRQRFGTEAQCRAALFSLRWGKGWACPGCGLRRRRRMQGGRSTGVVAASARLVSPRAPCSTGPNCRSSVWFLYPHHLTQSKGGISSVELARWLGTRQPTAWLIKHKLMAADGGARGGEAQAGGAGGDGRRLSRRAARWWQARSRCGRQDAVVAVVQTTAERKPRRLRLTVVKGFRKKEIATLAKRNPSAARSNVVTDGLSCWTAVSQAGCDHFPMVTGSGPQAAKWVPFTWVNTALSNIKTALAGTYHHVSAEARPALPRQLRLALQPPLPARHPDRAASLCLRTDHTASLPRHRRRMNKGDNQEFF